MSSAAPDTDSGDRRDVVRRVNALPPDAIREVCEGNFGLFADVVTHNWLGPKPEEWHPVPDHALDWHGRLHDGDASPMVLSARKHTKTTWVLCEILYELQYTPNFRVLYWCNNAENQLPARMKELEEMVEENLWLDGLHRGNPDHQNNVPRGVKQKDFPNGSTLYGTSVGGGVEGSHVNLIVGDDPLKEQGDVSDEDVMEFYLKVIVQMADGADMNTIVGTRKRPKDIYHLIRERTAGLADAGIKGYRLLEYPAIREVWLDKYGDRADEHLAPESLYTEVEAPDLAGALGVPGGTVSVLWPEARGKDFLIGKLARSGEAAFVREYSMVFTHVEDAIVTRSALEACSAPGTAPHSIRDERDEWDEVVTGVDPATADRGDLMAFVTVGTKYDEDLDAVLRHVLDVYVERGIAPARFKAKMQGVHDRYLPDEMVIEGNGFQQWIANEAVEFDGRLPVATADTGRRKHSWKDGVPKIASDVERGLYRFYEPRDEDDAVEELTDALASLRMDDNDKLEGHTPDTVMALYQAEKGLSESKGVPSNRARLDGPESDSDEEEREREEGRRKTAREKRRDLRGSPVGDAILGANSGRPRR